ncbi:MAG: hypothetical protein Q4G68_07545 [Planctomycetia bacterium]|nr:hypothetical protein [Planctomycetia bacterium]
MSKEQMRVFQETTCPTLYGDGVVPLIIIYTEYDGHHQNEEMNRIFLVHFALWEDGKVIWNAGNLDLADYRETQLTKESLWSAVKCITEMIPWNEKLECCLALEGLHTSIVAVTGDQCFFYKSDLEEGSRELAWTAATGWRIYTHKYITDKQEMDSSDSTVGTWFPSRPDNAISIIKCIKECVPLNESRPVDVLFFPSNQKENMQKMWENGIDRKEAQQGKWRRGMKIRAGTPWWK